MIFDIGCKYVVHMNLYTFKSHLFKTHIIYANDKNITSSVKIHLTKFIF